MPTVIRQINLQLPHIHPTLQELSNAEQVVALEQWELEIGFCTNPVVPAMLNGKVLLRDPFVAVLPLDHPLDEHNFPGFAAFAHEKFILPPRADGPLYVATVEAMCLDAGFVPRIVHETSFASTGLRLVEAGIGITIEPKSGLRGRLPGVKGIDLSALPQRAELTMLWHQGLEQEDPRCIGIYHELLPQLQPRRPAAPPLPEHGQPCAFCASASTLCRCRLIL